jgi:hypothetical protein
VSIKLSDCRPELRDRILKQITPGPVQEATRVKQDHKPVLNKLETRCRDYLKALCPKSIILEQQLRFKLGNGVWYKPDLALIDLFEPFIRLRLIECKGPKQMKGVAKGVMTIKIAAAQYPKFEWFLMWDESGLKNQRIFP